MPHTIYETFPNISKILVTNFQLLIQLKDLLTRKKKKHLDLFSNSICFVFSGYSKITRTDYTSLQNYTFFYLVSFCTYLSVSNEHWVPKYRGFYVVPQSEGGCLGKSHADGLWQSENLTEKSLIKS